MARGTLLSVPVAYGADDEPAEPAAVQWYERPGAVFVAGAAGLVVVGVLVFAVIQTSRHSNTPSGADVPTTSTTTTTSAALGTTTTTRPNTTLSTTDYTSSEPITTETTTTEATTEETTTTGTTTMSIPYPTTTTAKLAGGVWSLLPCSHAAF